MRLHAQTSVGGIELPVGHTHSTAGWYQQCWDRWTARKDARRQAKLAALSVYWDAAHETMLELHAEAAPEMAAAQHAVSLATMLYGLSQ